MPFDGVKHYGLPPAGPQALFGKADDIDWDHVELEPGTVDPTARKYWAASSSRAGDTWVGVTDLATNTHYMMASLEKDPRVIVNVNGKSVVRPNDQIHPRPFINGIGQRFTKAEVEKVYGAFAGGGGWIVREQWTKSSGGGWTFNGDIGAPSGIQHKTVAQLKGLRFASHWIGWSLLGTANPCEEIVIRFVSGRNKDKLARRYDPTSGARQRTRTLDSKDFDTRDLPTRWRDWLVQDLVRDLGIGGRISKDVGHSSRGDRNITRIGRTRLATVTSRCTMVSDPDLVVSGTGTVGWLDSGDTVEMTERLWGVGRHPNWVMAEVKGHAGGSGGPGHAGLGRQGWLSKKSLR